MGHFDDLTPSTYWVCTRCLYANEGMEDEDGPEPGTVIEPHPSARFYVEPYTVTEPLHLIPEDAEVTTGLTADEHSDYCPVWLGDPNRGDVPVDGVECTCERIEHSRSSCDGCGDSHDGERHALTVWTDERPWSAGWNMPGCLPDTAAQRFESWEDAHEYLRSTVDRWADEDADTDEDTDDEYGSTLAAFGAIKVDDPEHPFNVFHGPGPDLVLWVTRVE